jgi:surface protein
MRNMFDNATSFNQPLNNWNVSNVKDMCHMFFKAINFNDDLSSWELKNYNFANYIDKNHIFIHIFMDAKSYNLQNKPKIVV